MKLGSSIRRRRRGRGASGPGAGRRLRLGAFTLVLMVAGFGLGYFLATQLLFPGPDVPDELIPVPELVGMDFSAGEEAARERGLVVAEVDSVRHPTAPSGRILGQSPLPGQLTVPAGSVRVTLSTGPQHRAVPDVYRLRARQARTVLEATGFQVTLDSARSELPRGSVMAVEPEAGTRVSVPSEVRLRVSMGPPQVEMPVLVGLDEDAARARADSLGLVVSEVETRFRFGMDQGTVVEQEPPAGSLVEPGTAIRLVVGRRGEGGGR